MSEIKVGLSILNKEYTVACTEEERDHLLESADELNQRISALRRADKQLYNEQVIVMIALKAIYEGMLLQHERQLLAESNEQMLGQLIGKIDTAIRLHNK